MGSYDMSDESPERRFRTLFISDVHLGARGSQADLLLDFLRYHDAEGVICGHIHYAVIRDENGIRYMNCGDWVESCTALVEHDDGHFEIITWADQLRKPAPVAQVAARAA